MAQSAVRVSTVDGDVASKLSESHRVKCKLVNGNNGASLGCKEQCIVVWVGSGCSFWHAGALRSMHGTSLLRPQYTR